jgi:hypothetical protein
MRKISAAKSVASSPPGAGADFEHDVLLVVRILGQQQQLELLFQFRQLRLELRGLFGRHLPQFKVLLVEHGAGLR